MDDPQASLGPAPQDPPSARALFQEYRRAREAGEAVDFEALCAEHPEQALELRELYVLFADDDSQDLPSSVVWSDPPPVDPAVDLDGHEEPRAEKRLGRYVVEEEIGRGGMGAIYRAWDQDLRRRLALKVALSGGTGGAQRLGRFLEEAQVTGQLDHPGIVPVHELGMDERGRFFFAMRLVKGQDLRKVIERVHAGDPRWTVTRVVGVLQRACEALAYAHSKGVIHRDLKPGNVMVGRFGEVYVMDWGLARVLGRPDRHAPDAHGAEAALLSHVTTDRARARRDGSDSPHATLEGSALGTPAYMPPEQARGEFANVDRASDVYSMGAILYHLLTGTAPYLTPGHSPSPQLVLRWVIESRPRPVRRLAPDASPELTAICERAMARNKEDRYEDIHEMSEDLRAYLERRVVKAYESGPAAQVRKWVGRNLAVASVSAAVALVLLLAWVKTVLDLSGSRSVLASTSGALEREEDLRREKEADLAEAQRLLGEARAAEAAAARAAASAESAHGRSTERLARARAVVGVLDRAAPGPPEGAPAGFLTDHLALAASLSTATHRDGFGSVATLLPFPEGGALAVGGTRLRALDDDGLRDWKRSSLMIPLSGGTLDVEGGRVFVFTGGYGASESVLSVYRLADQRSVRFRTEFRRAITNAAYHAASDGLVLIDQEGGLNVLDATTGEVRARHEPDLGSLRAIATVSAVSADGACALVGRGRRVLCVSPLSGEVLDEYALAEPAYAAALSADGGRVALGRTDGAVLVHDRAADERVLLQAGGRATVLCTAFGPRHLAAGKDDGSVRLYDARGRTLLADLVGHTSPIRALAFSPDGERLYTSSMDGEVRTWSTRTRGPFADQRFEPLGLSNPWNADYAPTDSVIAATDGEDEVLVHRLGAGEDHLLTAAGSVSQVALSADGSRVAVSLDEGGLSLWSTDGGELVRRFDYGDDEIDRLSLSRDGSVLFTLDMESERALRWSADSDEPVEEVKLHSIDLLEVAVALSPDGRLSAVGVEEGRVSLYEAGKPERGRVVAERAADPTALAFSRDGAFLAAGWTDGGVSITEVETGRLVAEGRHRAQDVLALDFFPDGRTFVTGAYDGRVVLWDTETCLPLYTLGVQDLAIERVRVSDDGRRVVSWDGSDLRYWESDRERLEASWED